MYTVFSEDHNLHADLLDPRGDDWRPSAECPDRANNVLAAIRKHALGELLPPRHFPDDVIEAIHHPEYITFLQTVWDEWLAAGGQGTNARPDTFVGRDMRWVPTDSVYGKLGRYSFDATSPFVAGSWQAIRTSANIALTAAELVHDRNSPAFALCRPPGHHATADYCGGYCYLNNNALAAQSYIARGAQRVAVLDVDYHHGNGTQTIFYERNDVMTISLHADPALEYPHFIGYADEHGAGSGEGFNINIPLPFGTDWRQYSAALTGAIGKLRKFAPDVLVVALGLDTFIDDPTTHFSITTDDFERMGAAISRAGLPTLVVLEGGYSVDHIGINTVRFLRGIEGG
jgi:acetoin utilization deacetylase AcuC-like enzyme